ncbi:hypothetical protein C8R45DRAFT_539359 [Mycena sanguinolenta]|nr:hypothetical protein C8R45DRAFT_539359 [Mycena sanguinolenta]
MGSIIHWPSSGQFEDATEIASVVSDPVRDLPPWNYGSLGMLREDGSVRCNSGDVFGKVISRTAQARGTVSSWLSQANYISTRLGIVSNYEAYALVDWVNFSLYIPVPEQDSPDGYLFLRSPKDFATGPPSFRWPACQAYWSLDPSGSEPLSVDEASNLGFPSIELTTAVNVKFWNDAAYAGLRKFHVGKVVNPDSQDVAREHGYPLYGLSVPIPNVRSRDLVADLDGESYHSSSYDELVQDDLSDQRQDEEFVCCDNSVARHRTVGHMVELVKLGLIFMLGLMHLYEHARLVF